MKRKKIVLIGVLALVLAGCSGKYIAEDNTETAEMSEDAESVLETENTEQVAEVESPEQELSMEIVFPEDEIVRTIFSYSTLNHIDYNNEESLKNSIMREVCSEQEEKSFLDDYRKLHQIEDGKELSQAVFSKVVCYEKSEERIAYFLIHNPRKPEEEYPKYIICIEVELDAIEKEGYLSFQTDKEGRKVLGSAYDAQGEIIQSVSYQYADNVPFPIVSGFAGANLVPGPFAFHEGNLEYDGEGKIVGYKGHPSLVDGDDNTGCYGICEYDTKGRLVSLREDGQTFDGEYYEHPGHLDILYGENGEITKVEYGYIHILHSTWNSSGSVWYDLFGRPVRRSYYVTHGYHYGWFLYRDEEKIPYAYIEVCDMPYSSAEDEPEYWGINAEFTFWK